MNCPKCHKGPMTLRGFDTDGEGTTLLHRCGHCGEETLSQQATPKANLHIRESKPTTLDEKDDDERRPSESE
jgi:hypothetical protein